MRQSPAALVSMRGSSVLEDIGGLSRVAGRDLVERLFHAIEGQNIDAIGALLDQRVVYRRPGLPILVGRDAVLDFYRVERAALTSTIILDDVLVDGCTVVAIGLVEGRNREGCRFSERFADMMTIDHGLVRDRTTYFFRAGF